MVSFFDYRCNVPSFTQTDVNLVEQCGRNSGYMFFGILTILMVIGLFMIISNIMSERPSDDKDKEELDNKKKMNVVIVIILAILLEMFLYWSLPKMTGYFAMNNWNSIQEEIKSFMKQGLTRGEALNRIQSYKESEMQSEATMDAGLNIANALDERRNNNFNNFNNF